MWKSIKINCYITGFGSKSHIYEDRQFIMLYEIRNYICLLAVISGSFKNKLSCKRRSPRFKYSDLVKITNNFDSKSFLGEGGFGKVYQGKLKDGTKVAVKLRMPKSNQGPEQFQNEVYNKYIFCMEYIWYKQY